MLRVKRFKLPDGRWLAYRIAGHCLDRQQSDSCEQDPQAQNVVVYHHGWPSSSAEVTAWHNAATAQHTVMVAVDRPGVGGSTLDPHGSFSTYAADVAELTQHLRLAQVTHIGTSGGGPYACACAALVPHCTAALGLVASMTHCAGPGSQQLVQGMDWLNRVGFSCIAFAPELTWLGLALVAPVVAAAARTTSWQVAGVDDSLSSSAAGPYHHTNGGASTSSQAGSFNSRVALRAAAAEPDSSCSSQVQANPPTSATISSLLLQGAAAGIGRAMLRAAGATLPGPDRKALLQDPRLFMQVLSQACAEAFAQGSAGLFADMRLTTLPWSFSLGSISADTVVFQGDADVNVTVNMAKWLGQQIPGAEVRIVPHEAHFSLVVNHATEVLNVLRCKAAHRTAGRV